MDDAVELADESGTALVGGQGLTLCWDRRPGRCSPVPMAGLPVSSGMVGVGPPW